MILSDFQLLFIYWPIACHWSLSIPLKTSEKLRLSDIFGGYRNRPMVWWVNSNIWDKLFKNGPSKICLSRPYPLRFFKSCLPQILLSSCLNTLYHLMLLKFIASILVMHCKGIFTTLPNVYDEAFLRRIHIFWKLSIDSVI